MDKIYSCPICNKVPKIFYACGDFFVYCSDGCLSPMCDHPSKESTIREWNFFVENFGIEKEQD